MDVCKRDGSIETFHLYKIVDALKKAFESVVRPYNPVALKTLLDRHQSTFQNS